MSASLTPVTTYLVPLCCSFVHMHAHWYISYEWKVDLWLRYARSLAKNSRSLDQHARPYVYELRLLVWQLSPLTWWWCTLSCLTNVSTRSPDEDTLRFLICVEKRFRWLRAWARCPLATESVSFRWLSTLWKFLLSHWKPVIHLFWTEIEGNYFFDLG